MYGVCQKLQTFPQKCKHPTMYGGLLLSKALNFPSKKKCIQNFSSLKCIRKGAYACTKTQTLPHATMSVSFSKTLQ